MTAKRLAWIAIPAIIIIGIAGLIIALPGLVASSAHRGTIEALASSITGRNVHIAGNLSLSLFPEPQLIAGNVTIDGSNGETIKARSLTLDIAMPALLRGQLTASSLVLQSPVIAFPWPLPGGPSAVAPPPWLTALHAQINNGRISLGGVTITEVAADIFTGGNGTFSISGTGVLAAQKIDLTLSLGEIDATGHAPLAAELQSGSMRAHFTGDFSTGNLITGSIAASVNDAAWASGSAAKLTLAATLNADPDHAALTGLNLVQGAAALGGQAEFDFGTSQITTSLTGSNIVLPAALPDWYRALPAGLSLHDHLVIDHLMIGNVTIPHLDETSTISPQGLHLSNGNASFGGAGNVALSGTIDPAGNISAQARLRADLSQALGTTEAATPQPLDLTAAITGTASDLSIGNISGTLAGGHIAGSAIVTTNGPVTMNSNWRASQIDLMTLAGLLRGVTNRGGLSGNFELTSDHANLLNVSLSHLLIDGGFGQDLTIRRVSASLYGGVLAGSLTMQPDGTIAAAHGFLSLPSAAPLAALVPAWLGVPNAMLAAPLAVSLSAAGGPAALATAATATLGQFDITASPVINLGLGSAAGPLSLRHPSAIAAFKIFGINAGLAWPGAGSIALRSDFNWSANNVGFPNFVLSMGDLTTAGDIIVNNGNQINGTLNADRLALPFLPADLSAFWKSLPSLKGKIGVTANQLLIAGTPWLGGVNGVITLQPGKAVIDIARAGFGGGEAKGSLSVSETVPQPPSLSANFSVAKADLSQIEMPVKFPITLPSGTAGLALNASATGFSPQTWAATLSGQASLQAQNGALSGFSLAALGQALTSPNRAGSVTAALAEGITPFTSASISGNFDHGIFKIASSSLQGPAGSASASGSVDLSDAGLALSFGLSPNVTPPANIGLAMIGGWANPRRVPAVTSIQP